MKVLVNNTEVIVFAGATAADAVMAYCRLNQKNAPETLPLIFDRFGNQVEKDGALENNYRLFILKPENPINHE